MLSFSLGEMILNNVHLGLFKKKIIKESSWYIKLIRNGYGLINLYFTFYFMRLGFSILEAHMQKRGTCFFLNQNKTFAHIIEYWARKAGQHFSNQRWFIGALTNLKQKYQFISVMMGTPILYERYYPRLYGFMFMKKLPNFVFIISTSDKRDRIPIDECAYLKIPIMNVLDCWQDSTFITYPLPGNVSARLPVTFWCKLICHLILKSKYLYLKNYERYKKYDYKLPMPEPNDPLRYKETKDWWKKFYYWINLKNYLKNILSKERINMKIEKLLKKAALTKRKDYVWFFLEELKKKIKWHKWKKKGAFFQKKFEDSNWISAKRRKIRRFFLSIFLSQKSSLKLRTKKSIIIEYIKYSMMKDGTNYEWKGDSDLKYFKLGLKKNKIVKGHLEESDWLYGEKYSLYNKITGGTVLKKPRYLKSFRKMILRNLINKEEAGLFRKLNRKFIKNYPLNKSYFSYRINKWYSFWRLSDEERLDYLKGLKVNKSRKYARISKIQNMTMFKKKNKIIILNK